MGRIKHGKELLVRESELLRQAGAIFVVFLQIQRVDIRDVVPMSHKCAQEHVQTNHLITRELVGASHNTGPSALKSSHDGLDVRATGSLTKRGWRSVGRAAAREVSIPGCVNRAGVFLPLRVHVVDVVRVLATHEIITGGCECALLGRRHEGLDAHRGEARSCAKQHTSLLEALS